MSITVDYFFNYQDNLAAMAQLMNQSIGCCLAPYGGDPNDLFSRFLGMELSLSQNEFENDLDMNFEDYRFHLSLRTPIGIAELRHMQLPAIAFIAYVLYFDSKIMGMLVYDGQVLLARYEEREEEAIGEMSMYDTLSKEYVSFPNHLETLSKRLPEEYS